MEELEKVEQRCGICGSIVSLLLVNGKWLCEKCIHMGNKQLTNQWKEALQKLAEQYLESCYRSQSSDDPEDIHLARVTGRKIRALLEFLNVPKNHELLQVIRKMHKLLNQVREADVLLAEVNKENEKNQVYIEMVRLVSKKRRKLQNSLTKEIPAILNDSFLKKLDLFLNHELISCTASLAKEDALKEYGERFSQHVEAYLQSVKVNGKNAADSMKALHSVRIQSKSLRYMYHYLNETFGEDFQEKEAYYKNIQNQFGDINDVLDWLYQLKAYEKKMDATKSDIDYIKKKWEGRLHHLMEKVDFSNVLV